MFLAKCNQAVIPLLYVDSFSQRIFKVKTWWSDHFPLWNKKSFLESQAQQVRASRLNILRVLLEHWAHWVSTESQAVLSTELLGGWQHFNGFSRKIMMMMCSGMVFLFFYAFLPHWFHLTLYCKLLSELCSTLKWLQVKQVTYVVKKRPWSLLLSFLNNNYLQRTLSKTN